MDIFTELAEDTGMGTHNWNVRGYSETREVWVEDHQLTAENSLLVREHSQDFMWGCVADPTLQLALAIVLRLLGDEQAAKDCYQAFAQSFLIPLKAEQDFDLTIPIEWFPADILSGQDKKAVSQEGGTHVVTQLEDHRTTLVAVHHKAGVEHSFDKTMEAAGRLLNELALRKVHTEHELEEVLTKMILQVAILTESPLVDTRRMNRLMSLHLSKLQQKLATGEHAKQSAHLD